jgi:uncharacterized protein (TIGR03118 family)
MPHTPSRTVLSLLVAALALPAAAQTAGTYAVTNLVSDGSVPATTMDANFINPWGIVNATLWINTQGTGYSYVISPANAATPPPAGAVSFKVSIPAATGGTTATGSPTGVVITTSAPTGYVLPNGTKATFLFASLDGIITGWNSKLGTSLTPPIPVAQVVINNNAAGAVYTDIALATNTNGTYLLAANFGKAATIEVYDSNFAPAKLAGSFTDTTLPTGYAPFAVHTIGTQVFVTYALQAATGAPAPAPGNGLVNIFDTSGNFVSHAITTGGNLNAPWGLAIAPSTFGPFANDLLVGNFGDGIINAYDPKTFAYLGQLADGTGKTLTYASLWELFFGLTAPSSTFAGNLNTLYFAAGLAAEKHGLLGAINTNPTATGTPTYGFSASASVLTVADGSSATAVVSAVPTNNFSGTVTLACANLPRAATCSFSPATLNVASGAPATSTVTITTVKSTMTADQQPHPLPRILRGATTAGITATLLLPFGAFFTLRRRYAPAGAQAIKRFTLFGLLLTTFSFIAGCSSTSDVFVPFTPAGSTPLTITATSGSIMQSTTVNLTVH